MLFVEKEGEFKKEAGHNMQYCELAYKRVYLCQFYPRSVEVFYLKFPMIF